MFAHGGQWSGMKGVTRSKDCNFWSAFIQQGLLGHLYNVVQKCWNLTVNVLKDATVHKNGSQTFILIYSIFLWLDVHEY